MAKRDKTEEKPHSPLEREVLEILWANGECSAGDVRAALRGARDLSDSAVRTVLRRLTEKGYASHRRDGRRFLFRATMAPERALAVTIQHILGQLTDAGVGDLVVGMVESDMLSRRELQRLRERIDEAERRRKRRG